MNEINNIQAAIDAGRALGSIQFPNDPNGVILVPGGYTVHDVERYVEKYLPNPRRLKAVVVLEDVDGFIQYVNQFQTIATKVFATRPQSGVPVFTAILDYHEPQQPRWGEHRAVLNCIHTVEWQRWMSANGERMSQVDFASFLEENQSLVQTPPGAELLELTQNLMAKSEITCNQLVRLNNGRTKLNYDETVELKGTSTTQPGGIEFPSEITVGIAPFEGCPPYKITCRVRYRIESRRLIIWFDVVDVHLVIKDAVQGIVDRIQEKLGINPIYGAVK